jgi:hypothetical protein
MPYSEFDFGMLHGLDGSDLPYDVPAESDFADGWRCGRDVRSLSYVHVPDPRPLTKLPALTAADVADIRKRGGPITNKGAIVV